MISMCTEFLIEKGYFPRVSTRRLVLLTGAVRKRQYCVVSADLTAQCFDYKLMICAL